MIVLVDTLCSVAFYCQRCGQIEIADVPVFSGHGDVVLTCSHCGAEKARLRLVPRKGLVIETGCVVCGQRNRVHYPLRQLRTMTLEKIYCEKDHFELGYIGKWQNLAEFLDFNAAEYDALHPQDAYNFMEHQQILLEAFNRVHDLAEEGEQTPSISNVRAAAARPSSRPRRPMTSSSSSPAAKSHSCGRISYAIGKGAVQVDQQQSTCFTFGACAFFMFRCLAGGGLLC